MIKGLELSQGYWNEIGRPEIIKKMPALLECAAFGMAGEGSENFGFDDEISRDHDWGPAFCIWINNDNWDKLGDEAQKLYEALPGEFGGFSRNASSEQTAGRVGAVNEDLFFAQLLRLRKIPESVKEWMSVPEYGLAAACNGKVFYDIPGSFSKKREALMRYYPEDVRLKKLAGRLATAAQAGQYNYIRCRKRGEDVAAFSALAIFVENIQAAVFLLNKTYMPYYKWGHRKLKELPLSGGGAAKLLERLLEEDNKEELIEELACLVIRELKKQDISRSQDDFLMTHAIEVQSRISDEELRRLNLFTV